ncbi:MAG: hypothetical protein IIY77_00850, partial [Lachnospiraceae bacterium]|nr:hypothetical protein [Lachnospiraceae bacterium]
AMLKASYNGTVQEVILPYFLLTDSAVFMTDCGDKMPWDSMMLLWVSPETEGDPEKEALKKKILGETTDGYYVIVSMDTAAEASAMGSSLVIQNNLYQTPPEEILASYRNQAFVSDYETLIRFCMEHPETLLTARYSLGLDESKTEVLERYSPDGLTNLQFYLMWLLKLSGEFEVLDPEEISGSDEGKATVLYVEESAAGNPETLSEQVNGASLTVFEGQNIFRLGFDRKVYYARMNTDYDTASYMPEAEAYLRNLYDDAAYQAAVEKVKLDEMLHPVPQPGKTFLDAAKDHLAIEPAACELLDKDNCHVTEYYAFSVVPVDPATEEELAEIPADADSGYFRADIIWKAGNERSLRFHMAGSHMPYKEAMALQGLSPDPEVPEDAYIGSVFGKAEKSDEGWIVTMLGTAVR